MNNFLERHGDAGKHQLTRRMDATVVCLKRGHLPQQTMAVTHRCAPQMTQTLPTSTLIALTSTWTSLTMTWTAPTLTQATVRRTAPLTQVQARTLVVLVNRLPQVHVRIPAT